MNTLALELPEWGWVTGTFVAAALYVWAILSLARIARAAGNAASHLMIIERHVGRIATALEKSADAAMKPPVK